MRPVRCPTKTWVGSKPHRGGFFLVGIKGRLRGSTWSFSAATLALAGPSTVVGCRLLIGIASLIVFDFMWTRKFHQVELT
jgi:hypothetical protein